MTRSFFLNRLSRSELKVVVIVVVVVVVVIIIIVVVVLVVMTGHRGIHTTALPNVASQAHNKF